MSDSKTTRTKRPEFPTPWRTDGYKIVAADGSVPLLGCGAFAVEMPRAMQKRVLTRIVNAVNGNSAYD